MTGLKRKTAGRAARGKAIVAVAVSASMYAAAGRRTMKFISQNTTRASRSTAPLLAATLVFVISACAATVPEPALATRNLDTERCANTPSSDRLRCLEAMAPLREDEPTGGPCVGHIDGQGWATQAAPECFTRADFERGRCGKERNGATARGASEVSSWKAELAQGSANEREHAREKIQRWLADVTETRAAAARACDEELQSIERANKCLREWTSGYANVHGAGRTCFLEVERERVDALARRTKSLAPRKEEDALVASARAALAEAAAADKERLRKREAARQLDAAAERCAETWADHVDACVASGLDASEQVACNERCSHAMRDAVARATERSLEACLESFVEKQGPDASCSLARPAASTLSSEETERKRQACTVECRRRGPEVRARSQAEAAREAAERRREEAEERARPKRPASRNTSPSPSCGAPWYPHQLGSGSGAFTLMCDGASGGLCVLGRLGSGSFSESTIRGAAAACCCIVR